jgi:hypothetical protein
VPCPTGSSYAKRTVVYQTYDDTRRCDFTACSCQTSTPATCSCVGSPCGVAIAATSCTATSPNTVPMGGTCTSVLLPGAPTQWGLTLAGVGVSASGACAPYGNPTATGQVAPTGPITMCCM